MMRADSRCRAISSPTATFSAWRARATAGLAAGLTAPEVGGSVWGKNIIANVPASGNNYVGVTVAWTFHTIDGSSVKGFTLNGEGFLERVTQNNPRGAASELWEIRNISLPTVTS